jgi:prolyl oligopeptidase
MNQDIFAKSGICAFSNGIRGVFVIAASIAAVTLLQSCANAPALDAKPDATAAVASEATTKIAARKGPPGPPVAPVRVVTETFFGQSIPDPYRYMEDVKNPEVVAFMRAQGEHTRSVLDRIPGRAKMAARIAELSDAGIAISGVQITGGSASSRVFYYKIAPGETMRKLYVRDGFGGAERLLFDAQSLSVADTQSTAVPKRWALDFYRASPNGAHVVVGVAAGGSEETSLRIIEVAGGKQTGSVIDRIGFANGLAWTADSKAFFYNRLPAQKSGDAKNQYLRTVAFRHVLGRAIAQDEPVFGPGTTANVNFADIDIPHVEQTADGRNLIGKIEHGDLREISLYVADTSQLPGPITWRKSVEPKDGVTDYAPHAGGIYLLSHKDAPRYKIMRANLAKPDFASASTVVPQGDTVITQMEVAQDGLYIRELLAGVDRMQRLNFNSAVYTGGRLEFVRLPFDLAVRQIIADPQRPGVLLRLEGWTESPTYVTVEARSGNVADTRLMPKSKVDFENMTEVRLTVTAKDGAKVPLSLIYKKGTTLNAYNPALIRAYGAYGFTQSPTFSPTSMAWLERGGILATCHVRGGGEFGVEWHRAGQKLNKPNSWRDLIACSEYMIQRKFTRKELLAIQGGSAGGITVGRALTERPDLFAAVVPSVGVLDAMRAEFTPNGPPNIPEFGSVKTEDGFKGLLEMSSLHHVKEGTSYPAVLLMHGVNDPRVEVWHSAKMAARLQAVSDTNRNAKPTLLRLDYDAGHGVGSTKSQRNAELADIYSFLLWQFQDPEFQPK